VSIKIEDNDVGVVSTIFAVSSETLQNNCPYKGTYLDYLLEANRLHTGGVLSDVTNDCNPLKNSEEYETKKKLYQRFLKGNTFGFGIVSSNRCKAGHGFGGHIGPYWYQGPGFGDRSVEDDNSCPDVLNTQSYFTNQVQNIFERNFPSELAKVKSGYDSINVAYAKERNVKLFPINGVWPTVYGRVFDASKPAPLVTQVHSDNDMTLSCNIFVEKGVNAIKEFTMTLLSGFKIIVKVYPSQPFLFDSTKKHCARWVKNHEPDLAVTLIWYTSARFVERVNNLNYHVWSHDCVIWRTPKFSPKWLMNKLSVEAKVAKAKLKLSSSAL